MTIPIALTIAGSDSSGGAGIQADLKTFAACGVYGASVITALTAQNTLGVAAIHPVPADFVTAQIDAVFDDLDVKAVKIGMVAQHAVIDAIVAGLERWSPTHVVLDPVMEVATIRRSAAGARCHRGAANKTEFPAPTSSRQICRKPRRCSAFRLRPTRPRSRNQGRRLLALGSGAVLIKERTRPGHGERRLSRHRERRGRACRAAHREP